MTGALLITLASILAGSGIGVLTRRESRMLGPLRTFSVAAVVSVVVVQLLPESVERLGGSALLLFVLALALPPILAPLVRRLRREVELSAHNLGAELGFAGFLLHQFGEGLAVGTYAGHQHGGHDHGSLVFGVAAHTLPLTAVFIAGALALRGRGSALRRTLGLLAVTALGFVAASVLQHEMHRDFEGWLGAVVAGFLCHVILHREVRSAPRPPLVAILDVCAAVAGVALPIVASPGSGHGGDGVREAVGHAFVELVAETAPMLLLGLIIGAALQLAGSRIPARYFTRGGSVRQALRGIVVGAPLPLCACGVLPIAESLRKRGAGPAMVMAFLIATPELGPETLTLTIRFLGAPFAIARLVAALVLAFVAGLLFARLVPAPSVASDAPGAALSMVMSSRPRWGRLLAQGYRHFDELLLHVAPWTVVGLIAAAYVQAVVPAASLHGLAQIGVDVLLVGLIAMPSYVCAASATPLAAVFLAKGLSPGALLVGMLLGPATNVATIGLLRKGYGTRAMMASILFILVLSMGFGYLLNALGIPVHLPEGLRAEHEHGPWTTLSIAFLAAGLAVQLWRWGTRPWLDILDAGAHDHHAHDHHAHDGHDGPSASDADESGIGIRGYAR